MQKNIDENLCMCRIFYSKPPPKVRTCTESSSQFFHTQNLKSSVLHNNYTVYKYHNHAICHASCECCVAIIGELVVGFKTHTKLYL